MIAEEWFLKWDTWIEKIESRENHVLHDPDGDNIKGANVHLHWKCISFENFTTKKNVQMKIGKGSFLAYSSSKHAPKIEEEENNASLSKTYQCTQAKKIN